MKKVLAIAVLGMFVFTSCKKDYTCECCVEVFGVKSCGSDTQKLKKKDAEAWCKSESGVTCTLSK